jgi:CBS domain-containing protein
MKVKNMMHRGVQFVEPGTKIAAIAAKMQQHDIGAIPICDNGKPIGMVTDRDIAIRALANGKDAAKLTAKDVMTSKVIYCRDSAEAEDAVRIMEAKQIRRLPVLDDTGELVGMLSLGDISHAMTQNLTGEVAKAVSAHHA